ncbi:transposase [Salinivibrio costicola]|uniref:Transposase n=1 Tax=Salinivibrio costicola TaxID=51367 RepID=A0ABX6KBH7_SALCS|nr:transposase [Salinivibrio costicola]
MPAYKTGKKTAQYSLDFKLKAVEWSYETHRTVKSVAEALDIHPFMLSKWRKAYREGEFGMVKSLKDKVKPDKAKDELFLVPTLPRGNAYLVIIQTLNVP